MRFILKSTLLIMNDSQKKLERRKYMREYMRRRALKQKRKFPNNPRLNPNLYKGDMIEGMVQFKYGLYKIYFD